MMWRAAARAPPQEKFVETVIATPIPPHVFGRRRVSLAERLRSHRR
jgi:hypothetical protein